MKWTTGTIPIGLYWPPPPQETTVERYLEIAAAGFDFLITGNYVNDPHIINQALACADEVGLRVVVAGDPRITAVMQHLVVTDDRRTPLSVAVADAAALIGRAVDDYRHHPSFVGISLMDEPQLRQFSNMAHGVAAVRAADPELLPYVNLLPSHSTGPFEEYLTAFVQQVKPSLISFDRYPFLLDGDDPGYFADLAAVRRHAMAAGLPAWLYIQTLAYDGHRAPTAEEMLWQINTALAYGFSGFQYFTYWTPDAGRGEGFGPALVFDGVPTAQYDAVRRINAEWLVPIGRSLSRTTSVAVGHTGVAPLGAPPFVPDPWLQSVVGEAVVGIFESRTDGDTTRTVLVCNADHSAAATVAIQPGTRVGRVESFHAGTDSFVPVAPAELTFRLPPGQARLLRLRDTSSQP